VDQVATLQYANNEIDTEWIHYVLDELMGENCIDWSPGDVNHGTVTNVLEIVNLVNYILGSSLPDECEFYAGDLNGDEILNVLDIVQMVNGVLSQ
jgi:hypothetical protein